MADRRRYRSITLFFCLLIFFISGSISAQTEPPRRPQKNGPVTYITEGTRAVGPRVPPANDNFASAIDLSGQSLPYSTTINNFEDATIETGEPEVDPGNKPEVYIPCQDINYPTLSTAWYKYTPTSDIRVTIDLRNSNFDTILSIYSLSGAPDFANLTQVGCNDDHSYIVIPKSVVFGLNLTAGTTYYIMVAAYEEAGVSELPPGGGATLQFKLKLTLPGITMGVDTTNDTQDVDPGDGVCADAGNDCSLRAALMEGNELLPGSTINIPAGIYPIVLETVDDPLTPTYDESDYDEDAATSGDFDVTASMTIDGAGFNQTIIDGSQKDKTFHVLLKNNDNPAATLSDMKITGGNLVITDDTWFGGGLFIERAQATLDNVLVSDNAALSGGGIGVSNGTLNLIESTVMDNIARETTNSAESNIRYGGGIYAQGPSVITLTNATISDNTATVGAGIYLDEGALNTNFATIAFNGVTNETVGPVTVTTQDGGGIYLKPTVTTATINATIIANNIATSNVDCSGSILSSGNNVFSNATGCTGVLESDAISANAIALTAEANPISGVSNIPTHMLATNSPALDAAGATCPAVTTDQRGMTRPQGTGCDIGAVEARTTTVGTPTLIAPANGKSFLPAAPPTVFSWNTVVGAEFYTLTITRVGVGVVDVKTLLPTECPTECSVTTNAVTGYGDYEWKVTASVDLASNPARRIFAFTPKNFIKNPSFETRRPTNRTLPTVWILQNRTKDQLYCGNANNPAYHGKCAYYFLGGKGENSIAFQTINFTSATRPVKNDLIRLSAFLRTSASGRGYLIMAVTYTNGQTPTPKKISFTSSSNNNTYRRIATSFKATRGVAKVKVTIQHKSLKGKLAIDNMRLWIEKPSAPRSMDNWLPLPPAQ